MSPAAYKALRQVQEQAPGDVMIHMESLTWPILSNGVFTNLKDQGKGDVQAATIHLMAR